MSKVLIEVKGGLVQKVTVSNTNVEIFIIDYDNEDSHCYEFPSEIEFDETYWQSIS